MLWERACPAMEAVKPSPGKSAPTSHQAPKIDRSNGLIAPIQIAWSR